MLKNLSRKAIKKIIKNLSKSHLNHLKTSTLKLDLKIYKQLSNNKIVLNLQGLHPENFNQNKNYFNVKQNTTEWQKLQCKEVTCSRHLHFLVFLANLNLTEKEIVKTNLLNFRRGHQYQSEALVYLKK